MTNARRLAAGPLALACLWAGAAQGLQGLQGLQGVLHAQSDAGTSAELAKLVSALDAPAVEARIAALGDQDPDVRVDVAEALERISGRRYGQDAARWAEWREVWVAR